MVDLGVIMFLQLCFFKAKTLLFIYWRDGSVYENSLCTAMAARPRPQHLQKKPWLLPTPVAPVLREVKKNGDGLLVARQPSSRFN